MHFCYFKGEDTPHCTILSSSYLPCGHLLYSSCPISNLKFYLSSVLADDSISHVFVILFQQDIIFPLKFVQPSAPSYPWLSLLHVLISEYHIRYPVFDSLYFFTEFWLGVKVTLTIPKIPRGCGYFKIFIFT